MPLLLNVVSEFDLSFHDIFFFFQRYFMVDKGILVYGKSPGDVARGKIHGQLDIGLSVISAKLKRRRLDIDAEEFIYHLKVKNISTYC